MVRTAKANHAHHDNIKSQQFEVNYINHLFIVYIKDLFKSLSARTTNNNCFIYFNYFTTNNKLSWSMISNKSISHHNNVNSQPLWVNCMHPLFIGLLKIFLSPATSTPNNNYVTFFYYYIVKSLNTCLYHFK